MTLDMTTFSASPPASKPHERNPAVGVAPGSDLREDAANILGRMKKNNEPVVITQRGRAAAVMVSIEEYERSNHEREILRLLAQGDKEVAAGKGYELEEVLKEAERILAR